MADFEAEALAVLDYYFAALNAQDNDGMRDSFHFPHYRIAGGRMQVFETAEDYSMQDFHGRTDTDGWAYPKWDHRRLVHGDDTKVHFDVQFSRYRADDSVLGQFKSLWIVTNRSGKWGVMARSSYAA